MENLQLESSGDGLVGKNLPHDYIAVEGAGRHELRTSTCTGFEVANWKKALEQKKENSNRYYKGSEVSPLIGLPFFKMYGIGIYLFFSFVWDVTKFFLLLSILSTLPIVYNYMQGNTF